MYRKVLERAGLTLSDIDLFEVNEAFAVVTEKFIRDLNLDRDKVNVNGGAMALGHPIGATGAILIGTVLDELERRDQQFGLITMCAGGGMAPAIIIERCNGTEALGDWRPPASAGLPLGSSYDHLIDADFSPFELKVRVIPRAHRDELGGERAGRLVVRTTAAPVDDRANAAVCKLVAGYFAVRERDVQIVSGHRSRNKTVRVTR